MALVIAVTTALLTVWRRPKLSVHFDATSGEDVAVTDRGAPDECHWLRVRVKNARHRRTAESVEVLAANLRPARGHTWQLSGPVSFRTLGWTHYAPTERLSIAPGAARYLDILRIRRAPGGSGARNELHLVPKASDPDRYVLPLGEYEMALILTARDANARQVDIGISINSDRWPPPAHPASLTIRGWAFSSSRSHARTLIRNVRRWLQQLRGIQEEMTRDEAGLAARRKAIADNVPEPLGVNMAEAWLTEARSIYDHRDARLARVEARATTLQGTVSVAVPVTLAAAAVILDPNKVQGVVWRAVMAVFAFVLVGALVTTGWYAARAALKRRERLGPRDMQSRLQAERTELEQAPSGRARRARFEDQRIALHLREQVVDLLVAADLNKEMDGERTTLLVQARCWFQLALVVLVVFAMALSAYAVTHNPGRPQTGGAEVGAKEQP